MKKLIFKLFYWKLRFLFLMAVLLAGCASITGRSISQAPNEISKTPEAYFCPKDDCSRVFEKHINSANFSVHCAFYDINLRNIISSLANKSKSIDVKAVIDSSNYKEQIKGDGIRLDNNNQLMHNIHQPFFSQNFEYNYLIYYYLMYWDQLQHLEI